jgi:hypothetical protein
VASDQLHRSRYQIRISLKRPSLSGFEVGALALTLDLYLGAVAVQADSRFLDSAVAIAPAALGMTRLREGLAVPCG